jgi:hypothetical protein
VGKFLHFPAADTLKTPHKKKRHEDHVNRNNTASAPGKTQWPGPRSEKHGPWLPGADERTSAVEESRNGPTVRKTMTVDTTD